MTTLFEGKVLVLGNEDMNKASQGKDKVLRSVSGTFEPVCKASYVLYFDDETQELTLLKARKNIILKHGIRK